MGVSTQEVSDRLIVDPDAHSFHPNLMADLQLGSGLAWHSVKTSEFLDGSPYLKIGVGDLHTAVVPLWMTGDIKGALTRMQEIGNALAHEEQGYSRRAKEIFYVFPYLEGRGDQITRVREDVLRDEYDFVEILGEEKMRKVTGEAVYAEMFAEAVAGPGHATMVLLLDPHSVLVHRYMKQHVDRTLTLTAVPLFADWIRSQNLVDEETVVVAPDIGSISRAVHLAELLDVPLVVCNKWRPKHNSSLVTLRHGSVKGKRAIGIDEVIDSGGTITEGAAVLHNEGARELIVCSTSAKFSGPAISRFDKAIQNGHISRVVTTDTLPSFAKGRFLAEHFYSISIAPLLLAGMKSLLCPETGEDLYGIAPFVFRDETPQEAYMRLQDRFNLPPLEV